MEILEYNNNPDFKYVRDVSSRLRGRRLTICKAVYLFENKQSFGVVNNRWPSEWSWISFIDINSQGAVSGCIIRSSGQWRCLSRPRFLGNLVKVFVWCYTIGIASPKNFLHEIWYEITSVRDIHLWEITSSQLPRE